MIQDYIKQSWHLFPCVPKRKTPLTANGFKDASNDPNKIKAWLHSTPNCNWGISTGPSNLLVIDLDVDEEQSKNGTEEWDKLQQKHDLPQTLSVITGGGGRHLYFSLPPSIVVSCSQGKLAKGIDVRSTGGYVIAPPSIHPDGPLYTWDSLKFFPEAIMEAPQSLISLCTTKHIPTATHHPSLFLPIDHDDLAHALSFIPSDHRETWLRVGMALQTENLRQMWDDWSKQSRKYNERKQDSTWKSFKRNDIKIGTIYHMARDYGWMRRPQQQAQILTPKPKKPTKKTRIPLHHYLLPEDTTPPGFVKDFANWITATSRRPQHALSTACALSTAATLIGQTVQSSSLLRSNIYFVGVAKTGAGKDHPRKCVKRLFHLLDIGKDRLGGERIASGSALFTAASMRPVSLFLLDEFGLFLESAKNKTAGHLAKDVISCLLQLFSSASSVITGTEYSLQTKKGRPRVYIEYPCASLFATTTPETFYTALSSETVASGFLGRFVVAESHDRPRVQTIKNIPIPKDVIDRARKMLKGPKGNILSTAANPYEVLKTPVANSMFLKYQDSLDDLMDKSSPLAQHLWARAWEMADKVAMILACSSCPSTPIVNEAHAKWAIKYIDTQSHAILGSVENRVSDSVYEGEKTEIMEAIKAIGKDGITMRDMGRKKPFKKHPARRIKELLEGLVSSGEIVQKDKNEGKQGRPSIVFLHEDWV